MNLFACISEFAYGWTHYSGFIVAAAIAHFFSPLSLSFVVRSWDTGYQRSVSMTGSAGNDDEVKLWHARQVKVVEVICGGHRPYNQRTLD